MFQLSGSLALLEDMEEVALPTLAWPIPHDFNHLKSKTTDRIFVFFSDFTFQVNK